jgi:hypothetical protein
MSMLSQNICSNIAIISAHDDTVMCRCANSMYYVCATSQRRCRGWSHPRLWEYHTTSEMISRSKYFSQLIERRGRSPAEFENSLEFRYEAYQELTKDILHFNINFSVGVLLFNSYFTRSFLYSVHTVSNRFICHVGWSVLGSTHSNNGDDIQTAVRVHLFRTTCKYA